MDIEDRLRWTEQDPARLRQAAYRMITRTQDDPSTQVHGLAIALVSVCKALDINIRDLLVSTEQRRDTLDGAFVSTFDALEAYARNEIGRV